MGTRIVLVLGLGAAWFVVGCSLAQSALAPPRDGGVVPVLDTSALDVGRPNDAWSNVDTGPRRDAGGGMDAFVANDAHVAPVDASVPPDMYVAPVDAFVPPDMYVARVDAFVPPDMYVAPVDAFVPPDMWRSCDTIYGGVPGYHRCADNATTCVFVTLLDNSESCNTMCNMGSRGCSSQYNNGDLATVCGTMGPSEGCGTGVDNGHYRICTCAH